MRQNYSRWLIFVSAIILPLLLCAGGKPSRGTPADKRLAANKPGAAKPAPQQPVKKPVPKKG